MWRSIGAALATLVLAAHSADAVTLQAQIVVTLFTPAPGTGLQFGGLGAPILNEQGDVAFNAGLGTPQQGLISPFGSVWTWREGTLQPAALPGQVAPSTGGATFGSSFGLPHLNEAGQLAFGAQLTQTGPVTTANDGTFYVGAPGALGLALREGSISVPGSGAVGQVPSLVEFGNDGQILTEVTLGGAPTLLLGAPGALAPVAGNVTDFGLLAPGQGSYGTNTSGVNRYFHGPLPGAPQIFAAGQLVGPDAPGVQMSSIDGVVNASGEGLFFSGFVEGAGGVTSANNAALLAWDAAAGAFDVLLREGDPLGDVPGWTLQSANRLTLGESGDAAFLGVIRDAVGSTRTGLFAGSLEEGFSALVVAGEQAPGMAPGTTIRAFFTTGGTPFSNFTSNGLMVFEANVDLPGGGAGSVLYALLPNGELRVVAQTGDMVAIEGGQLRPVLGFSLADMRVTTGPTTYASQRILREDGVLAVQIGYGSGTNAANYLLDLGAVPEPGTLLLLSAGLAGLGAARRRR